MDLSIVLMVIGIICIVASFFIKDTSKKVERDLEELSISIYQETNSIKRRLKVVEEELLLEPTFQVKSPKASTSQNKYKQTVNQASMDISKSKKTFKPINEILVRQVIELKKQGYSILEISKRSTLSEEQITYILTNNGGL